MPKTKTSKAKPAWKANNHKREAFTGGEVKKMLAGAMKLMDRQTKAYERIAKGIESLDLARPSGPPKEILALIKRATPILEKLLASGERASGEIDEMGAARERQKVVAAKRAALARDAWERNDKHHHGADCAFDACVCPLYFATARVVGFGSPLSQEDGGESTGAPDFEVKS